MVTIHVLLAACLFFFVEILSNCEQQHDSFKFINAVHERRIGAVSEVFLLLIITHSRAVC